MQISAIQNNKTINFQAGLTSKMKCEIKSCEPERIAKYFIQNGIPADFKNNKVLAWCTLKSFEVIQFLNQNYGLNLGLPRGIVVENFRCLKGVNPEADGFCTTTPCKITGDKYTIPENVIFINEYPEYNYPNGNFFWDKVDEIADLNFENKQAPTDHFLHIFLHEFSHAIHNRNLLRKIGTYSYMDLILKVLDPSFISNFQQKYGEMFSKLCQHATTTPYEAVACDLGKRLTENLDTKTLIPTKNSLLNTPYIEKPIIIKENDYEQTLRSFFNGNFD